MAHCDLTDAQTLVPQKNFGSPVAICNFCEYKFFAGVVDSIETKTFELMSANVKYEKQSLFFPGGNIAFFYHMIKFFFIALASIEGW